MTTLASSESHAARVFVMNAQTYGDVWTDAAKEFLEKALDDRAAKKSAAPSEEAGETAEEAGESASP